MAYRVIQWSTGNVGRYALRGIVNHPDMELAGVWVHSAAKAGRDAGELCGVDPVGVEATSDVDALLALDADCVCYTATADLRPMEALEDLARILVSGKNVVSSSLVPIIEPRGGEPSLVEPLEKACAAGGVSMFTSGIDPGWANDLIPLALTGACERVDSVRITEILNYATYDQPTVLFETMGFGKPLDETPVLLVPGILEFAWGGTVRMIAAGLGVELDEITAMFERRPAERRLEIPSGVIEEGTAGALRFEVQGIVNGRPAITVEHVTRLDSDLAPDWPQPTGQGCYRIVISGEPWIQTDIQLLGSDGDENTAGLVGTAMRLVNAIPAVVAAPPGLVSTLDLPLTPGRGLLS